MEKNKGGRPTVMTPDVLSKLEIAWSYDATDAEACFLAEISEETLYNYQRQHPEYLHRKNQLKQQPVLQARKTVVEALKRDPKIALAYLERKKKNEFAPTTETNINVQVTGYVHSGDLPPAEDIQQLEEGKQ